MTSQPLHLLLIAFMFPFAFLGGRNATVVLQQNTNAVKECHPFTCLRGDLDETCEIRTKKNITETTCRYLMRAICGQVEENDRKFLDECHKGMKKEGKKCSKCEVASKICRAVIDTLPSNVRFVSMSVPKTLKDLSGRYTMGGNFMFHGSYRLWGNFMYHGGSHCRYCKEDDRDK